VDAPRKTTPLLLLAGLVFLVGIGAGAWLITRLGDTATSTDVPTEQQVLGTTSVPGPTTARLDAPASTTSSAGGRATGTTTARRAKDENGFTLVTAAQLPKEARDTLARIASGGPFPSSRDGTIFQNREGILPKKPTGYYREYTVITPGEDDRGARRIVSGTGGERYYTADHYDSFVRVEVTA
jgi:ribonuclease T1